MSMARTHLAIAALGLAAAITLGACGDDDDPDAAASGTTTAADPTSGSATVEIADFAFGPGDITVAAGGTVTFTNGDQFAHTAQSDDGSFDTGTIDGGASSDAVTFGEPGTFSYFCGIHNYMTGTVTVTG